MGYELHCGDGLEFMATLPAASIEAIITDLPYGTTACAWDEVIPFVPMWEAVKRVLKPRGVFVTTASQPFTSALVMSNLEWFRYALVWEKQNPTGFLHANYRPMKSHEDVLIFSDGQTNYNPQGTKPVSVKNGRKSKAGTDGIYNRIPGPNYVSTTGNFPRSVLRFDRVTHDQLHPTQKPVALYAYLIRTYTNPGDTVLDFCCGSGTTGVAAIKEGRNFIGVELDEHYFNVGRKRMEEAAMQMPLFTLTA